MALSTRWLVGVAGVVAAVLLVSVLFAAFSGRQALLPPDTPGGVVQRYLQAVADRDAAGAVAYLDPALEARCDDTSLREQIRAPWRSDFRAVLDETHERPDSTDVWVTITEGNDGGPFGGGGWTHRELFTLRLVDGAWVISEPPFPAAYCPPIPAPRSSGTSPSAQAAA